MLTLRLTQSSTGPDQYRVEMACEGDGSPRQTAVAPLTFRLSAQEHEDVRWYLEDYLQHPLDLAPKIAARVEQRMAEIGAELLKAVFQASDGGCRRGVRCFSGRRQMPRPRSPQSVRVRRRWRG